MFQPWPAQSTPEGVRVSVDDDDDDDEFEGWEFVEDGEEVGDNNNTSKSRDACRRASPKPQISYVGDGCICILYTQTRGAGSVWKTGRR